ncbi:hypothetical protein RFI_27144, partial [Reticulomyxa filosa]
MKQYPSATMFSFLYLTQTFTQYTFFLTRQPKKIINYNLYISNKHFFVSNLQLLHLSVLTENVVFWDNVTEFFSYFFSIMSLSEEPKIDHIDGYNTFQKNQQRLNNDIGHYPYPPYNPDTSQAEQASTSKSQESKRKKCQERLRRIIRVDFEYVTEQFQKTTMVLLAFSFVFLPCLVYFICTLPLYLLSNRIILGSWLWGIQRHWLLFVGMYRLLGTLKIKKKKKKMIIITMKGIVSISPLVYVFQSLMLISVLFDEFIFMKIKTTQIKSPVFITGCVGSGTSYLHQVLTHSSIPEKDTFVFHRLWEILIPSLTLRTLVRPLVHF